MTSFHATRLDRLERSRRPARQRHTFIPLGIAHTDSESFWLAAERQRLGLSDQDELIAFTWGPVQDPASVGIVQ